MNKQSTVSIVIFAFVALLALILISSLQVPIFLSSGSDSLETIIKTSSFSQWLALALFLLCWFFCFVFPKLKHKGYIGVKVILTFIALSMFVMSGHNFRYSGKQHALIDSWFFIPVQTLDINPTTYIENSRVGKTVYSVDAYSNDAKLLSVWLGLPPWRLNENKVLRVFYDLGFEQSLKVVNRRGINGES